MRDEYLWDGSGEPDPDVEKLEGLLGRYRSERPAPELPETPVVPFRPRRPALLPFAAVAAAAAIVLSLSLGLWWRSNATPAVRPSPAGTEQASNGTSPNAGSDNGGRSVHPPDVAGGTKLPRQQPPPVKHVKSAPRAVEVAPQPAPAGPTYTPLVDVATADHLEQAELLLRSFRNASADDDAEVAFDSKQSRELLDQNALLRRSAAAKKNLPVGQLLGDLEPFLLDIANLGDKPSRDDVREIQYRIERREMVSDLELYSANRPAQGF